MLFNMDTVTLTAAVAAHMGIRTEAAPIITPTTHTVTATTTSSYLAKIRRL